MCHSQGNENLVECTFRLTGKLQRFTHREREREDCVVASRHNRVIMRKKINCFHLSSVQFKSTASKCVCVVGLMAMMADDPEHPDVFLLTDSEHGETHTHNIGKAKQK